jgi:hypothetical protein
VLEKYTKRTCNKPGYDLLPSVTTIIAMPNEDHDPKASPSIIPDIFFL